MTSGGSFKRKVRARMRLTGERYTTALVALREASGALRPAPQQHERQAMQPSPRIADLFRRFSDRSRVAIGKSENLARREGSPTVDARHLLLGAIAADGLGRRKLAEHGDVQPLIDAASIDDAAVEQLPHVPYSPASKKVLEQCLVVAVAAGDNEILTTHVIAALLDNGDDEVRRMLTTCGVDLEQLRAELPAPDGAERTRVREQLAANAEPRTMVEKPVPIEDPC